jgi:hypothetical protein
MKMTGRRIALIMALVGGLMVCMVAGINAADEAATASGGTEVAPETAAAGTLDVIEMNNTEAFAKHTKALVQFTHGKHAAAKPDGHGIACGECHHDENAQPLSDLKAGDPVQHCFECHNKTEKPKKSPEMSVEEWKKVKIQYYYTAMHQNCQGCHKEQGGPVKCAECHPQKEK